MENLRGNVNTRLRKLKEAGWNGAVFAQAGLERIGARPAESIELDWMLPAPAQGAIVVVGREGEEGLARACAAFDHLLTRICTGIERDFLRGLKGGCSTPVGALAKPEKDRIDFKGAVFSVDGKQRFDTSVIIENREVEGAGLRIAQALLERHPLIHSIIEPVAE